MFYLNENWQETDGGALRLYLEDGAYRDIYPHAGTLLLFLSAQFEHAVLPATRDRMSIACWMRQRPLGAAGCRLMTTMLHELERTGGRYGLVSMCCGGGLGTGTLIERL